MLKIVKECKNPAILVITPLAPGRKISSQTKASIQRNYIPYVWASWESPHYHARNVQDGINAYKKEYGLPEYIQVLDDDIILNRHTLDRFHRVIVESPDNIGFVYCPFSYRGHINISFPAISYDIHRLMRGNWISSNSLYKAKVIEEVGGFVIEDDTQRLSDWALWLRMYLHGYIGELCPNTSFVAVSSPKDLSAGSTEEYRRAEALIIERFVNPIKERMK
jgi:hypothetical protein